MATIHDVAKRANVSAAAVSYAFNKPHLIKPETYERILEAARALDYTPNVFAQALRGAKTQMVGLLVPDIRSPYVSAIARAVEDTLNDQEYFAVVASTDGNPDKELEMIKKLHRRGASSFIVIPIYYGIGPEALEEAHRLIDDGIPFVVGGHRVDYTKLDTVHFRPQMATRDAVNHLIELGHRDIGFIGTKYSQGLGIYRWLGYQESLLFHQIPVRPELIKEIDITPEAIKKALSELLTLSQPPTAIFAFNDLVTSSMLDFCLEQKIAIPEDLSIVGFDYQTIFQRTTPAISGIVVSAYELGRKTAELLRTRQETPDLPPQEWLVEYQLAERDTTAPLEGA
ncbi:MAG: LacI family DNA-binding transcriptional regulator [Chloroflexota bacterium]